MVTSHVVRYFLHHWADHRYRVPCRPWPARRDTLTGTLPPERPSRDVGRYQRASTSAGDGLINDFPENNKIIEMLDFYWSFMSIFNIFLTHTVVQINMQTDTAVCIYNTRNQLQSTTTG